MANEEFADKNGWYNRHHFPFIQILGAAPEEGAEMEITDITEGLTIPAKYGWEKLKSKFLNVVGEDTELARANQEAAWNRLNAMQDALWTPRAMQGAEYERGGFHATVAHFALQGDLGVAKTEARVDTKVFPAVETLKYAAWGDGTVRTLKAEWKKAHRLNVKDDIETDVYIIAPKKYLDAAEEMIRWDLARSTVEKASHRGIDFTAAVAYQSLSDGQKARIIDDYMNNVGWFDLSTGVFFTIDKEMFKNVAAAMGAEGAEELLKPKMEVEWDVDALADKIEAKPA